VLTVIAPATYIAPLRRAARLQGALGRRRSISLIIVISASEVDRKPLASTAFRFTGKWRSPGLRAV
jgi:hypothetical protein